MDEGKLTADRLKSYLSSYARYYPGIWQQVDYLRAGKGKGLPSWEAWCFLPLAAAKAIGTPKELKDFAPIVAQTLMERVGIIGS